MGPWRLLRSLRGGDTRPANFSAENLRGSPPYYTWLADTCKAAKRLQVLAATTEQPTVLLTPRLPRGL